MRRRLAVPVACLALALTGCGGEQTPGVNGAPEDASPSQGQAYPEVRSIELTPAGQGTYDVAVTISSPYDSPERYADGWRVMDQDGEVLGVHELTHDHADEQPFTRTQYALEIPADVDEVTVEGRDLRNGFGGGTRTVDVPD
ncbi:hypothetical protein KLP28_12310 [Nocardioidaceae bacterium]|nr:hypothetical protein KLP28_12310 [Nocardioidaceae bacterium]